jgi:hypothetical protein
MQFKKSEIATATVFEEIRPTSNVTGADNTNPLAFKIHGTDQVIDFSHSYILISGEMTGNSKTGNAAAESIATDGANVGPVCNFPNCLFSRMTIIMNNKEVSAINNFPYVSYLNTRLNHDNEKLSNHFKLEGWVPDDPGSMENTNPGNNNYKALGLRKALGYNRKKFQFLIRPPATIFSMDKVLIPHVDVEIILDRNVSPQFFLMYPDTAGTTFTYNFSITQAEMYVRKMDTISEYNLGLEGAMTHAMSPVVYTIRNPQIITQNIAAQKTMYSLNDVFHGYVPERVLVMFVETSAFRGKNTRNPFNFQHFDIEYIGLFKNGVPYPHPPVKANFTQNRFAQAYYLTMKSLQSPEPGAPAITYEEFKSGTTIFSYDLTPDQAGGLDPHQSVSKKANIRLDVNFSTPLAQETMMLIYYEQDVRVSIDHTRAISVETIY